LWATTKSRTTTKKTNATSAEVDRTNLGRIFFAGNPWPEGHAISEFEWTAHAVEGRVRCAFHLKSANYYAERRVKNDEDADWLAASVWDNYHACTLSSTQWHEGSFDACALGDYTADKLDGLTLQVDKVNGDVDEDRDGYVFHIYLLGHDAVANHLIEFKRIAGTDCFNIDWSGNVALAYAGRLKPEYKFRAQILNVKMPKV
jgi:hypothetical protein